MEQTNKPTATEKISFQILARVAQGENVIDAMKAVCGAEKVDAMIDALYTELRAKAVAA